MYISIYTMLKNQNKCGDYSYNIYTAFECLSDCKDCAQYQQLPIVLLAFQYYHCYDNQSVNINCYALYRNVHQNLTSSLILNKYSMIASANRRLTSYQRHQCLHFQISIYHCNTPTRQCRHVFAAHLPRTSPKDYPVNYAISPTTVIGINISQDRAEVHRK